MIWDLPKNQIHVNWYPQQILAILLGPPFQASETETIQKKLNAKVIASHVFSPLIDATVYFGNPK